MRSLRLYESSLGLAESKVILVVNMSGITRLIGLLVRCCVGRGRVVCCVVLKPCNYVCNDRRRRELQPIIK